MILTWKFVLVVLLLWLLFFLIGPQITKARHRLVRDHGKEENN
jgi:hypothetical protein